MSVASCSKDSRTVQSIKLRRVATEADGDNCYHYTIAKNSIGRRRNKNAARSSKRSKAVGKITVRHLTSQAKGKDYYCCMWNLKKEFFSNKKEELKSPVFTVPNRNKCKWYLSVQTSDNEVDAENLDLLTRLHLSPKSKCQAAVADFRMDFDGKNTPFAPSGACTTFKFMKESEKSAVALSIIPSKELQSSDDDDDDDDEDSYDFKFLCTIMILAVIPEDRSFSTCHGSLLENNRFTDVVLSVGKKKFPVHKAILSTRSSVFAAMFTAKASKNQNVVNIKDIRGEVVEQMLNYIYTGDVDKLKDLAQDLLIAAHKYDLKGLKSKCEEVLIKRLSSSNVFELALFADSYDASSLKYEAAHVMWRKKTELMNGPGWKDFSKSNAELARKISLCDFHPEASDSDDDMDMDDTSSSNVSE